MSVPTAPRITLGQNSPSSLHYEQRRIGHICAILVRNLSLRPTRDRALQTLASRRPGGSNRYHTTSDDADLTLSLARSNSKGKAKAEGKHRRRRSTSWASPEEAESTDEQEQAHTGDFDIASTSTSPRANTQVTGRAKLSRGRSDLLITHRRTSDHDLTTSSSFGSTSDGTHSVEASPRPILKRASSHRDGRDARIKSGSPAGSWNAGFLDELGANTTMLSRSDSRSSSRSSRTVRRPSHRARTTSMTSTSSVRSVRFDESQLGDGDGVRRPSRVTGRLNAASRYALFSHKSLAQIMKDRMLECYVELSLVPDAESDDPGATSDTQSDRIFYRAPSSKPGLHHSWGYQSGDPITPERDFTVQSKPQTDKTPLEQSTVQINVWARTPRPAESSMTMSHDGKATDHRDWKLVCQTSSDLRDLEPLSGNLQDASLSLPPNAILLGLAPGANSLSGHASLARSDSQKDAKSEGTAGPKDGPQLRRKMSEREAERTRHILESITYYAVPLKPVRQPPAGDQTTTAKGQTLPTRDTVTTSKEQERQGTSFTRSPQLQRRVSREGYNSDPEQATSRKSVMPRASEPIVAPATSLSSDAKLNPTVGITPDARRQQRRKAFEDEQKRVLELSLRETKMMPSYDLDQAKRIAKKQADLRDLLAEVDELRQNNGDTLADPKGFVQLRLQREQQEKRCEAVKKMAGDESDHMEQKRAELTQRKAALEARQRAVQASTSLFEAAEAKARQLGEQVRALSSEKVDGELQLHSRQASLLRDLETIFPIELSDASSLLYSVCGLPLPNAVSSLPQKELLHEEKRWKDTVKRHVPASSRPVFHPFDDDTVSSALGLVAQLVVLLSTYLATPIHYPLATAGSRAVVQDGISLMSGPRAFPLYAKGMERYRYEYAVFLLNKDIEQLMNVYSVTVIDIRHTLPNLKNLMVTVAAAPPTSHLTRKSHIGKKEIALRSVKSGLALSAGEAEEEVGDGKVKKGGLGIGLGLPSLTRPAALDGRQGKSEVAPDTLVTTRVLGAPSAATATQATASGAIASVSRAFSYFSSAGTR